MPEVPAPAAHRTCKSSSSSARAGRGEPDLRVTKTLWPGQAGTVRLHQRYGRALVCVRYRRDATGLRRTTTVELVVAEALVCSRSARRALFDVKIGYAEHRLQAQARAHQRRSFPDQYGYNVGCLEGINPFDLEPVPLNDGVNHPADRAQ